jgi:hypothetical protein
MSHIAVGCQPHGLMVGRAVINSYLPAQSITLESVVMTAIPKPISGIAARLAVPSGKLTRQLSSPSLKRDQHDNTIVNVGKMLQNGKPGGRARQPGFREESVDVAALWLLRRS